MKKNTILIILGILVLGTFLRFYRFFPNLILNGEMGTDYLNVWGMIHGTHTWLIGPRTSHEWFFVPPLAYWIYVPVLLVGKYSPAAINVFWGIVGSSAIFVSYYYIKKIFNEKIALISSILIAVSPAWIVQTRASRYNLVVSLLFLPYLYYLNKSIEDKGKSLFKLGLTLGLMMSFFPSPLLLIPAAIVCFIFYRVKLKLKYIALSILGFLIPNVTFIAYEITNKFAITIQLLTWVPYRILGFFGIYHKNTASPEIVSENTSSIYKYIYSLFITTPGIISIILFTLIIVGLISFTYKNYSQRKKETPYFVLVINFIVCYIGLFIHGNPPDHYYYTIYSIPIILIAYFIDRIFKNRYAAIGSTLVIVFICVFSIFHSDWFYTDKTPIDYKANTVPYTTQLKLVDVIQNDSFGKQFSLARIGVNDQFEDDFANNYIYLLAIRGTRIDVNSKTRYTIIEGQNYANGFKGGLIFSENQVYVFKTTE